ncbi:MAG: YggS family pyridoxal phosphate-dependent enzyme [Anaerolineae bacterium]|nr:YggS family pyridoxal phosphate-dependent enzyme [Anaerolineae bacterium]
MDYTEQVQRNLEQVKARIGEAAIRAGRKADDVKLVAVSKTFPTEAILAAWEAGQRDFGENRPEEGERKIPIVQEATGPGKMVWHMIGHIQSRKAKLVVEYFNFVHSVDRLSIARKLNQLAIEARCKIPVLLECNVSGEASKYGYDLSKWQHEAAIRQTFFTEIETLMGLPGLEPRGLMTMAPIVADPEETRPVFASLRSLGTELQARYPQVSWDQLSMGMTDDFEVAVEEGATLVRIGRAIFGSR